METASFNGFLKTVLYIVAFFYIFKFLARIFLPILVKKAVEKVEQNVQQKQQTAQANSNREEILYAKGKAAKAKNVGEYVDYEEIK